MNKVRVMLDKLGRYYWSPQHPYNYTMRIHGKLVGVGLIAGRSYASFNVAWATLGRLDSYDMHMAALSIMTNVRPLLESMQVDGGTLEDIITLRTEAEFKLWYSKNKDTCQPSLRYYLDVLEDTDGRSQLSEF